MKLRSGGQTGVDLVALDVALELNLPCGGWCPKGRRAENGPIPSKYPLEESTSTDYKQRTEWNVRDSDGTLILTTGLPTGGTALTIEYAEQHKRPCLVVDLDLPIDMQVVKEWILSNQIYELNVAGPRASKQPRIYNMAVEFLRNLIPQLNGKSSTRS